MKGGNLLPMTLIILVMVSALFVVQIKHRNQALTSQLDHLRHDQQQLDQEWSQLQLEQATLAQHGRVDQLARTQFGMVEATQAVITGPSGPATVAAAGAVAMATPSADRVGAAPTSHALAARVPAAHGAGPGVRP